MIALRKHNADILYFTDGDNAVEMDGLVQPLAQLDLLALSPIHGTVNVCKPRTSTLSGARRTKQKKIVKEAKAGHPCT